jgi:LmbE family N-acetylglucosaminyl deacetylase
MPSSRTRLLIAAAALVVAGAVIQASPRRTHRAVVHAPLPVLTIEPGARLLVVAPHPDDETIGAGGLIQQVRDAGGAVRIVYLTDGEGYPDGVRASEHRIKPDPFNYRDYGKRRQHEAREALRTLGVDDKDALTFLGFPNNGLNRLMTRYWSERRRAFRSPYTRLNRPPKAEIIEPDTEFRGEDLTQELAQIIGDFKPTLMAVTRRADQHVDHCAAWYFAGDALGDVQRVRPDFQVQLLSYIVHFNGWPFDDDDVRLEPPALYGGTFGWVTLPLSDAQVRAKRQALHRYTSQMKVMDWFLDGFARSNEVFGRPAVPRIVLPVRRSPCDDFVDPTLTP